MHVLLFLLLLLQVTVTMLDSPTCSDMGSDTGANQCALPLLQPWLHWMGSFGQFQCMQFRLRASLQHNTQPCHAILMQAINGRLLHHH